MGTEIEVVQWSVNDLEVMSDRVAKSKLFGLDAAQAFTLMLLAQSEGIHPMKAMQRYHIISGKPAMKADAMLADFLRVGGTVEWITEADDTERCEALFRHPQFCPKGKTVKFSVADARKAELTGNKMWSKYPANMMRARVISNGIRMIAPGIVAGLYTPEEVQDFSQDEPRPHHAVNNSNGTGHGSGAYAPPETVAQYQDWIKITCEEVNTKWLDSITGPTGEINTSAPGEIVTTFQLSGHLLKWAKSHGLVNAPDDTRAGQRDKFGAVAWETQPLSIDAEAKDYCRRLWREARAKIKPQQAALESPSEDELLDKLAEEGAVA